MLIDVINYSRPHNVLAKREDIVTKLIRVGMSPAVN